MVEKREAKNLDRLINRIVLFGSIVLVSLFVGFVVGYCIAAIQGDFLIYDERFQSEEAVLKPVLHGRPEYKNVHIFRGCDGHITLTGSEANKQDYAQLGDDVRTAIGGIRLGSQLGSVEVRDKPAQKAPEK